MQTENGREQKNFLQRYGWIALVVGLVAVTTVYIIVHRGNSAHGITVRTATVKQGRVTQQIFSTGTVASAQTANLFPPTGVSGNPSIKVSVGNKVQKGQTLVTYPKGSLQDQVNSAQAVVSAQEQILANARQLLSNADNTGVSHKADAYIQLEQSVQGDVVQLQNAQSQLKQAQEALAEATVKSPFAGTVVAVNDSSGSAQVATTPLVQVSNLKDLEIDASLSQANSALITPGKKVVITSTSFPGKSWHGTVKKVDPIAASSGNNSSANVNTTVTVPRGFPIHPGFNVNLTIDAKNVTGLTIPYSALVENGNGSQVWVVRNGKVKLVTIDLGITGEKVTQVTSGLKEGNQVVVNPPQGLVTGEDVSTK